MTEPIIVGQPHRAERSLFSPAALAVLDKQTEALATQVVEQSITAAIAAPAAVNGSQGPTTLPPASDRFADCSSNNPRPDLASYKAVGRSAIAIKGSEGTGYTYYAGNDDHAAAHAIGLRVGRYHWLRPDSGSAIEQAGTFWAATKSLWKPGDWYFADWETSYNYSTGTPVQDPPDASWAQFMQDFMAEVARSAQRDLTFPLTGLLYTGNWYLDGKPAMQAAARKFSVIIADYSGMLPVNNRYELTLAAHQYTSRAAVSGFAAPLDDNYRIDWGSDPRPKPPSHKEWDEMATKQEIKDALQEVLDEGVEGPYGQRRPVTWFIGHPLETVRLWHKHDNDSKRAAKKGKGK